MPGEYRDFSSFEINNAIRDNSPAVHGAETLTFGSGGHIGGSPIAISLLSNNIEELKAAKIELKNRLIHNSQLKDVADNDPAGIKEVQIKLKDNAVH